jgi:aspartate/methionine/tyrosine aminotransferase
MIEVTARAKGVEYAIRDVILKANVLEKKGKKILYLNIGDPGKYDFDTPLHIKQALEKAVREGHNYYSPSNGLPDLRQAIAAKEKRVNGVEIDANDIVVTTGESEAILFLAGSIVNPGDEVLLPGPCYPPYISYVKFFDGKPVTYRTVESKGWTPDIEDFEKKITERTKLIVIINPNNPCGAMYSRSDLTKMLEIAASHDLPVVADEIYDGIVYDGSFQGAASLVKDVPIFGLNGFSKTYLMTGWRLGYIYMRDFEGKLESVWDGINRLSRVRLCASTPVQKAAVEALTGPQGHIPEMVSKLRKRRDLSWKRLNEIPGLSAAKPPGAFYIFPKIESMTKGKNDSDYVTDLLNETGVLVVHGSGFDPVYGKDHFRVVFLPQETILNEAFDKIEDFMKKRT